ncbi:MAG: cardiolipin synthase [Planctomycetota bacterium]|nr:MAG: cardiolipin synthase [Planctomycetota bacterium]
MWAALLTLVLVFAVFSAGHAMLYKRDPRSAFGWLVTCLALPIAGTLLYWAFGVNRIRIRAQRLRRQWPIGEGTAGNSNGPERFLAQSDHLPKEYRPLIRISDAVTRRPLLRGNRVEPLVNGDQAYPAMLEAIGQAQTSVHLSTYIFQNDGLGKQFVEAFRAARNRGVEVLVLVDWLGEFYSRPRIGREFLDGSVSFARFLPSSWFHPNLHLNLRNHRKLLVVDGELGFTGGLNIGERYLVHDPAEPRGIRDLHFRVQGPVVAQMAEAFWEDWTFASDEKSGRELPQPKASSGDFLCRAVSAGPNEDFEKLNWILGAAISTAHHRIAIMTPYFVPNRELVGSMRSAALRGVRVELILPETNNIPPVAWATQAMLWELVETGVRVFYQPGPFVHTKLFLVDEHYAQIGSANLDPRSLRLNFEFNLEVYSPAFVEQLLLHFDSVRDASQEMTLAILDGRPIQTRLRDSFAKLFSPYL